MEATLPAIKLPAGKLPAEIQWMPPGKHTITGSQGGKPTTLTAIVDEVGAERMSALLTQLLAKSAAGEEDMPYIDFNHEDAAASGHPTSFRWGGDDPKTGGIRAAIDWTGPGRVALEGKSYRRFSPSFYVDSQGRVLSAPLNMGGLVNRAAFKTIAPIVSREASGSQPQKDSMSEKESISPEELAALNKAVALKDTSIADLKSQVTNLQTQIATQAKSAAKDTVDAAIKAGKLAPQATALHGLLIDAIAATPALAGLLDGIAPNPAFKTVVTAGSAAASGTSANPEKDRADKILARAREIQASGMPFAGAYQAAQRELEK